MKKDREIRKQLAKHLEGGLAFTSIESILDKVSFKKIGVRSPGLPYSIYEVFYHITFAQKDILDYMFSNQYIERDWPKNYWPDKLAPESEEEWKNLKAEFFEDRRSLKDQILNSDLDLSQSVQNSMEHSLFREIMLVIEHNAYYTGQLLIIQRLLGVYVN
tara:strand:+ start:595 stop:1074 length:480 start_codon:yes stop_codon:yes gene_type:complete